LTSSADTHATFLPVARCQNVKRCLESDAPHPCREIVRDQMREQSVRSYDDFQVPEPWVGELDIAPILFISSNPSIGDDRHAVGASSDETLWDSHQFAFGGGRQPYILDGINTTTTAGNKLKKVAYWVAVRARARELISNAVPGRDYALTEVVHCKSTDEIGVTSAAAECARMHLDRVLAISPARVLIVVGKAAFERLQGFDSEGSPTIEEREIGGQRRLVVYLPHPASWAPGPRTLSGLFPTEIARLRREANSVRSLAPSTAPGIEMHEPTEIGSRSGASELVPDFLRSVGGLLESRRAAVGATYLKLGEVAAGATGRKVHANGPRDLCQGKGWVWPPYARAIMVFLAVPNAENLADRYEAMHRLDGRVPRKK
jgi:uracil-DNA glycosylase